jgi:transcriptional regulator with PAS, ATPase and Fis domain
MGALHCRIVGKPVEEWEDDEAELDLQYLQAQPIHRIDTLKIPDKKLAPSSVSKQSSATKHSSNGAIGASAGFFGVIHRINRVASTRATVLLLGESGVGKSMFACEVHRKSSRANQPFVQLNCATIPEGLLESELFGVNKGAYTGATETREGKFEAADGGTLFLDEIALLSLTAQAKLLRVLQTGELEHLGSTTTRKVDVRVVAATNENLQNAVEQGRFRKDLYYRLNVFPIVIPPLRERRADIPLLLEKLLKEFCERHGRQISGVTNRAMQTLLTHPWPGNIRELENVLERGIILAEEGGALDLMHLFTLDENQAEPTQLGFNILKSSTSERLQVPEFSTSTWAMQFIQRQDATLDDIEKALISAALESAQGNISKAATLLGISRAQLDYRVKKISHSKGS